MQERYELKGVLFDLEGTLVETLYQRSREDLNQLRKEVKRKLISLGVPENVLINLVSATLLRNRACEWVALNQSQVESTKFYAELNSFRKPYEMRSAQLARLYPDTLETLESLTNKRIEQGLVTNTSQDAADYMLKRFGLRDFFKVMVTRNDSIYLKPNPSIVRVAISRMAVSVGWFVGDMVYDAEAARKTGLKSIIVVRDGVIPSFIHDYYIESLSCVESIIFRDN